MALSATFNKQRGRSKTSSASRRVNARLLTFLETVNQSLLDMDTWLVASQAMPDKTADTHIVNRRARRANADRLMKFFGSKSTATYAVTIGK